MRSDEPVGGHASPGSDSSSATTRSGSSHTVGTGSTRSGSGRMVGTGGTDALVKCKATGCFYAGHSVPSMGNNHGQYCCDKCLRVGNGKHGKKCELNDVRASVYKRCMTSKIPKLAKCRQQRLGSSKLTPN
jgi:hypothetical protein